MPSPLPRLGHALLAGAFLLLGASALDQGAAAWAARDEGRLAIAVLTLLGAASLVGREVRLVASATAKRPR